ncbi:RNA 2',3'-cyclic phosphodiesterase [Pseudomonas sp. Gutcm_11s]|uniref:RNA 2',3'-cyclic phosphodiesterase n=1 Tax=Pseudomonas sp. Gutcm_11s TaxID=3026088 RepID=UPI002361248A|nr:RNA 2',3'-cyclic phosphodiesterase [Pseudomonas sp. Gutcm_11s]MDD0843641.1 RNA 2',3'-cyclic phosphodiesterase [Pseudomonas sp. Gutcm_11s]
MLRLFFALPCPAEIARQIDAWRQPQHLDGRLVPVANLHVTLAFLGHLPESRLPLLRQLPQQLPLSELAFDLQLDRLDCWHGGLLHLAPSQLPAELMALAGGLRQLLDTAGLPGDGRAYRPHLTLARESSRPQVPTPLSVRWRAEELVLYQSEQGGYLPLASWPLG